MLVSSLNQIEYFIYVGLIVTYMPKIFFRLFAFIVVWLAEREEKQRFVSGKNDRGDDSPIG